MRFSFEAHPAMWSVLPALPAAAGGVDAEAADAADTAWVQAQIEAYRPGPLAADGGLVRIGPAVAGAAREALGLRRPGIEKELFFRPVDDLVFGMVHLGVEPVPEGAAPRDLTQVLLPGIELLVDPVIDEFTTDVIRDGRQVAYVTRDTTAQGTSLTGFAYAFEQDGMLGVIWSEVAVPELTTLMRRWCDPVVASLELVP